MTVQIVTLCLIALALATSDSCPGLCTCKWKNGKRTVECTERGLIKIPQSVDSETQVLDVSLNNLQSLPRQVFAQLNLVNLQKVFLRSCRLGQIHPEAFSKVTNLIELDLSGNLLTAVPSSAFKDTPFLRELVLSTNPIQKIEPEAFRSLPSLVKLDLSNCEIKTVSPKAFSGLETLELLKINDNHLSELPPHSVDLLQKLHGVELHSNPWNCDCRLRAVKEWLMSYNIAYSISPKCSGGPERLMNKALADVALEELACKPELLPTSRYLEAVQGDNVTVTCRASAVPSAQVKWYFNGKLLRNESDALKVRVLEQGAQDKRSLLQLYDVQDLVELFCVAENRAGSAESNFTVRVVKPLSIISLNKSQIAGLSAALAALIFIILLVISALLIRVRRFNRQSKPSQLEVVTVASGAPAPTSNVDASPDLINDHSGEYARASELYWNDKSPIIETSSEEGAFPRDYGLPRLPPAQAKTVRVWQKIGSARDEECPPEGGTDV